MLLERTGCLALDSNEPLIHGISIEHFLRLFDSKQFYFTPVHLWPDPLDGNDPLTATNAAHALNPESFQINEPTGVAFGHCWIRSRIITGPTFFDKSRRKVEMLVHSDYDALSGAVLDNDIYGGAVNYRRTRNGNFSMEGQSFFGKTFLKDDFWSYEQEFRIVRVLPREEALTNTHTLVNMDPRQLIQKVTLDNDIEEEKLGSIKDFLKQNNIPYETIQIPRAYPNS
jgi:hypothetical protein